MDKQPSEQGLKTVTESKITTEPTKYLAGWRLMVVTSALGLAIFLVTMEVSIVATALVPIADHLHAFDRTSWIVTAYLLTYTGFLIIFAKLSDLVGRKSVLMLTLSLFIIFSGACAAVNTIEQLIILRAFQGVGASGCYSVTVAIFFELVPPSKFAFTTSLISAIFALAFLIGPFVGGAITQLSSWKWVFLLNVPAGVVCIVILSFALPNGFPNHNNCSRAQPVSESIFKKIRRLDLLGTLLLLASSILLVTGLQQAGNAYRWDSPLIITCLVLSALTWIAFFAWSRYSTAKERPGGHEPVFPWRFVQSRTRIGMLISIFLTGMPFTVAVIQIPLRFQAVDGLSPLQAGIRLLPYAVLNPLGSILAPWIAKRFQIPPIYIMVFGASIQVVGAALLTTAPTNKHVPAGYYVYEGIAGFGTGLNLACLIVMTPFAADKRDKAVAMSAMVQSRILGGALGLAIVTTVFTGYVTRTLMDASFSSSEVKMLLESTKAFAGIDGGKAHLARTIFAKGHNFQMAIVAGLSGAQILAALLLWEKPQIRIPNK
ncbi:MFS multidrug transporter-like protein [Byssothecium circinans]|uniref:MFS multidrug transporter-like protein n=1 Tax=Byssothecium circinans TaxID=147558 RepID=A0A6A5TJ72_9PLEO|nr:MFS multidrug transporter-like protein [Byssothecium circinans]